MKEYQRKFSDRDYKDLMTRMEDATNCVRKINEGDKLHIYNSNEVCKRLGISEALLAQYRLGRLLPYSRVGDKYFYTDEYLEEFIKNTTSNTF